MCAQVVVASEFSACSSMLNGSLKLNPFYAQLVADTLDKALSMDLVIFADDLSTM